MTEDEINNLFGGYVKDLAEMGRILSNVPDFIKNALEHSETAYHPRLRLYLIRGLHGAEIQLEEWSQEYYRSTMNMDSSFYSECVFLSIIESIVGYEYEKNH